MSLPDDSHLPFSLLQFYSTAPYVCSYLPDRMARSQVATPVHLIDAAIYSQLIRSGFRRSGPFIYCSHCDACRACMPVRLPVDRLELSRSQRRAKQRHANLETRERPLLYDEAHYRLYARYQSRRHPGGGMDEDNDEQYSQFLLNSPMETRLMEFTENGVLRMVSIIDMLDDGISSVYTFFDPDVPGASYGTYNILWQAALCQRLNLPYLYLGYWIRETRKMTYKANFHPIQGYVNGIWRELAKQETGDRCQVTEKPPLSPVA
ncbi:MAG: arginyltransferase [Zoogloeaceae bacterium]|jgi:arginine-tRNA-protein transferase|nr:arginyltransferase [Zoogloeaceae bacterium]